MTTFYNENDPYAAQWLRNLLARGCLPAGGVVDERSIEHVETGDLAGYRNCHFFAGIGGWPYALQLAGWPADRAVWTGSCPCQPFSGIGHKRAAADERHLWPAFFRLIAECRPPTIFGEQVAGPLGEEWLAAIRLDLEGLGYAVGAADLPAASVGAPHQRQRLFWVAHRESRLADTIGAGLERHAGDESNRNGPGRQAPQQDGSVAEGSAWSDLDWLQCLDGKYRPIEPGLLPLAPRIPGRVGRLRAYGNAIVPQVAAKFIKASMTSVG